MTEQDTTTYTRQLLAEVIKLRTRIVSELESQPAFGAPEAEVGALMTRYASETSGVVILATDTGREFTLMGSHGWVLTYDPPQAPDAVVDALAAVDAVKTADLAFLSTVARDYGADSTPAANLAELLVLRKLADAVRASLVTA